MVKSTTFAERLNLSLDTLGFPPKHCGRIQQLADMVGLSHRGAGKWVNGQSAPPARKFPILARQLQVNEEWLRTGEGLMRHEAQNLPVALGIMQPLPIYHLAQVTQPHKQPYQTMTCLLPYVGDFYGLILRTEAMSPRFPPESIIIFDTQAVPKDGDFVLAIDPVYPEPVFRQLLITNDGAYLHAHNPKFDRLVLHSWSNLRGKLVQAIVFFD